MAKYINIGGYDFKVVRPRTKQVSNDIVYIDIFHAYKTPSSHKVSIFRGLERSIASLDGVRNFGITGAGCNFFSVGFEYTDVEGNEYVCKVSAYNNTAYLVG